MLDELIIKSAQGSYRVCFSKTIQEIKPVLLDYRGTHFVSDRVVFDLHKKELEQIVGKRPLYLIDATEDTKTLTGVSELSSWLQKNGANRSSSLVAVGGGITQDLVTFTAHVYYRGIPWVFLPTTLLSMCDSSIGAKCGINLNDFKNQLGVFQSPKAVFTCLQFLETLPDFHMSSGYGEILKLHLTGSDWGLFTSLVSALEGGLRNDSLQGLIKTSLNIKREIIEIDEYETDLRRVLNYGHSFGHSLESITHHEIPHGLAVAWGIDLINFIAMERGYLSEKKFVAIHELIKNKLPFKIKSIVSSESLINGARKDKKTDNTGINLIFLMESGSLEIKRVPFDEQLAQEVSDYLRHHNVYAGT